MNKLYLVTGASGHVGSCLVKKLMERNENIRVFVLPQEKDRIPEGIEIITGDITDKESIRPLFNKKGYDSVSLIHIAGLVSVTSKSNPLVWKVNAEGTRNVLELSMEYGIDRFVYISSVDVIPEKKYPELMSEVDHFSVDDREGDYARSKAMASQLVLDYAEKGLNASIIHPSAIIGPGDDANNSHTVRMIRLLYKWPVPFYTDGAYDFVDVRDVTQGILLCEEKGKKGECYILSGEYITVEELISYVRSLRGKKKAWFKVPLGIVKTFAPLIEKICILFGDKHPAITPYSIDTLASACAYTHKKATEQLGYEHHDIRQAIKDSI